MPRLSTWKKRMFGLLDGIDDSSWVFGLWGIALVPLRARPAHVVALGLIHVVEASHEPAPERRDQRETVCHRPRLQFRSLGGLCRWNALLHRSLPTRARLDLVAADLSARLGLAYRAFALIAPRGFRTDPLTVSRGCFPPRHRLAVLHVCTPASREPCLSIFERAPGVDQMKFGQGGRLIAKSEAADAILGVSHRARGSEPHDLLALPAVAFFCGSATGRDLRQRPGRDKFII